MQRIFTILIIFFVSVKIYSQSLKQQTADNYYKLLAYSEALPIYEDLAGSKKKINALAIRRAAECAFKLNDYGKAEKWYAKTVSLKDVTPEELNNYIQTLRINKKYDQSDQLILAKSTLLNKPLMASNYTNDVGKWKEYYKDSSNYRVTNVAELNTEAQDFGPFLKDNRVYFTSSRRSAMVKNEVFTWDGSYFLNLYQSQINNNKPENPQLFKKEFNSKYHEGPLCISPNHHLFITRSNFINKEAKFDKDNLNRLKIFYSLKDSIGNESELINFTYNNDNYSVGHPFISPDNGYLYFTSDKPGSLGETDIWRCKMNGTEFFEPENLGNTINTEGKEMFPSLTANGDLIFASNGRGGLGGLDLYIAKAKADGGFEIPVNMNYPINSNYDDYSFFPVSATEGFFSSNRLGGKGSDDIYKVNQINITIEGIVKQKNTSTPIAGATVFIYDDKNQLIDSILTGSDAYYKKNVPAGINLTLLSKHLSYLDGNAHVSTKNIFYTSTIKQDIDMDVKCQFAYKGNVTDARTGYNMASVKITVIDKQTNSSAIFYSNDMGTYSLPLEKNKCYALKFENENYVLEKTKEICIDANSCELNEDIALEEGDLHLKDIYFDLDKYTIRADAEKELCKLAHIMSIRSDLNILISSHTDCRASNIYNIQLSKNRANSTIDFLNKKGISKKRFNLAWFGEQQLQTNCPCESSNISSCSEDQHQLNRRSSFSIITTSSPLKKNILVTQN